MIYTFRIISAENKDFICEVDIDSQSLFIDFHNFLNSEMAFDPGEMASFFLTDRGWQKQTEITLLNMMEDEYENILVMSETRIGDLITEKKQRLLYVFDLFAERILFMELIDMREGEIKQPDCVRREGEAPPPFLRETLEDTEITESDYSFDDPGDDDPYDDDDIYGDDDQPDFIDFDEDLY